MGLLFSWQTDLKGLFRRPIYNSKKLQPISICTGIKNRTSNYLENVVNSVLLMNHPELIELSVFDCGSNDKLGLEQLIGEKWKGKLIFTSEEHPFERSYSFNRAITQSSNELIFAADADMILPSDLVEKCNYFVTKNTVWFPICFNLKKDKPAIIHSENGEWRYSGMGMFAAFKSQFIHIGKYDEKYKTWGEEDWDLWLHFYKYGIFPIRKKCIGLFHVYHDKET